MMVLIFRIFPLISVERQVDEKQKEASTGLLSWTDDVARVSQSVGCGFATRGEVDDQGIKRVLAEGVPCDSAD